MAVLLWLSSWSSITESLAKGSVFVCSNFLRSILSILLASSLDIVIAVDNEGQIIFYNDGAYQTLGYTLAEIRGKHVTTVYPSIDGSTASDGSNA